MTTVNLLYRRPDGLTTAGVPITKGSVRISAIRRYDTTQGEMTTAAIKVAIGTSVVLNPGTWLFELVQVSDGRGGFLKGRDAVTYRAVPASVPAGVVKPDGSVDVDDLDEVDPTGADADLDPEWKAYIDAAIAGVSVGTPTGSGPGGSLAPLDIYGVNDVGSALMTPTGANTAARQASARGTIGAAPAASPSFTGNPTAPTATAGDNDTTVATTAFVQTALAGLSPGTVADATTSVKGKIKLAGDLAGTADAPEVPGLDTLAALIAALTATVATHTSQIAGISSPFIIETSPGVYPNRDVTSAGVMRVYIGVAAPPKGGTVSSGTFAVDGLDGWWRTT